MVQQVSLDNFQLTINDLIVSFSEKDYSEKQDFKVYELKPSTVKLKFFNDSVRSANVFIDEDRTQIKEDENKYNCWIWKPWSNIGLYELKLEIEGNEFTTFIRVDPTQVTLQTYEALVREIANISYNLLFDVHSISSEMTRIEPLKEAPTALMEYEILKTYIKRFKHSIYNIAKNPHKELTSISETVNVWEVRQFNSNTLQWVLKHPEYWTESYKTPFKLYSNKLSVSYDVYENRLIKYFITQLISKTNNIVENSENEIRIREKAIHKKDEIPKIESLNNIIKSTNNIKKELTHLKQMDFLKGVSDLKQVPKISQVLQKEPHYFEFYQIFVDFFKTLGITYNFDELYSFLHIKKMSNLYEYFCLIKVYQALKAIGFKADKETNLFKIDQNRCSLVIESGASIELHRNNTFITMYYEKLFDIQKKKKNKYVDEVIRVKPVSETNPKPKNNPDITLEILDNDGDLSKTKMIILDAKFKVDLNNKGMYLPDDIELMRIYRDGICYWKNEKPYNVVKSAYILYPGTAFEKDDEFSLYEIGAIPLLPDSDISEFLDILINNAIES